MSDPMYCTKVNEYFDDELSSDERNAFEEHLIQCPACQDELERLLALQYKIVALPKAILPQRDLWPRIEASVRPGLEPVEEDARGQDAGESGSPEFAGYTSRYPWSLRAAAVVFLMLAAGVIWLIMNTSSIPTSSSLLEQKSPGGSAFKLPPNAFSGTISLPSPSKAAASNTETSRRHEPEHSIPVVAAVNKERTPRATEVLEQRLNGFQLQTTALLPSSAGKVSGFVLDEQGRPVRGMTVEIVSLHRTALTDNGGKFEFFGLSPDAYTLQVHGIGYQQNTIPGVKIIPGFTTQVNFVLRSGSVALADVAVNKEQLFTDATSTRSLDELPSASYVHPTIQSNRLKIEGKVTDERGRSIVGAVVLVLGTKRGGYSDNEGNFHIYGVPPGSYTLEATASGFQSKDSSSVKIFSDFPVEINMALEVAEDR